MKAFFTPRVYVSVFVFLLGTLFIRTANAQCPDLHATISNGPIVNMCSGSPFILHAQPTAASYQWQKQTSSGGLFENIANATLSDYETSMKGSYRVVTGNGTCYDTSAITTVIQLQLSPGVISGGPSTKICSDSYVGSLSGPGMPGDIAGVIKYQWQIKEGNGSYMDIPLAKGLEYNAGYVKTTTSYRRATSDNCGNVVYSNELTFTIYDLLTSGTLQPATQTINVGQVPATIGSQIAATGDGNLSYKWQFSLSVNGPWTTIDNATGETYTPGAVNVSTFYRRLVYTDVCSYTATTVPVMVTIKNPIVLNAGILYSDNSCLFPGNTPYPIGTKIKPVGGVTPYLIEWESKTATGEWTVMPGESGEKLFPGPITETTSYRKKVTDASGTIAYTEPATLNVISAPLDAGQIGGSAVVACLGSSPGQIISVKSGANFGERGGYQWQVKTGNGDWENLPGAIRGYYQPQPLTETTSFRRMFVDACGPNSRTAYSNVVVIEIKPELQSGEIAPATQNVIPGKLPKKLTSITAPAGGTNSYTIWWEKADIAAGPFAKIAGANGPEYQPPVADKTTYYRRVVRDNNCMAEKTSFIIEVFVLEYPPLNGGNLAGSNCVFPDLKPSKITSGNIAAGGGIGPYTFEWESKVANGSFAVISGATGEQYQPPVLTQTTQFRRKMTDAYGTSVYSEIFTIQLIGTPLVPGKIEVENSSICAGASPGTIKSVQDASGGGGQSGYQWQQRTETGTFTNIAGANSKDYTPATLMYTTYFRRVYTDGCSGITRTGYSNEVMIKATPVTELLAGLIKAPFITCSGTAPGTIQSFINACGSCNLKYQWQSNDGNGWTDIAGADGTSYTPGVISENIKYRRKVTDGLGRSKYSNEVEILVYPKLIAGTIGTDNQVVCKNATPSQIALLTDCHYTDGTVTYQWQMSSTGNEPWTNIEGAINPAYQPLGGTENKYYRLKVTSTSCNAVVYTNVASVLIKDNCSIQISSTASNVSNCVPISPVALSYPVQPCNADYLLEWEYKVVGGTIWMGTGTGTNNFAINSYYQENTKAITWRLKMTSVSCNSVSYTNQVSINQLNCRSNSPVVYPNPASPAQVVIIRTNDISSKITLMTVDGKRLDFKIVSTARGMIKILLPASIPSGTYILEIKSATGTWTEKLLVNN